MRNFTVFVYMFVYILCLVPLSDVLQHITNYFGLSIDLGKAEVVAYLRLLDAYH